MSTFEIIIKDKETTRLLQDMADKMNNLKPAMQTLGEIVRSSIERNFAKKGRPGKWEKSRRVRQAGGQTLSDTGRLRRSFTVKANPDNVVVGTNVEYAPVHHFGAKKGKFGSVTANILEHLRTSAKGKSYKVKSHTRKIKLPWGNIPARPFMMVQDEDLVEIRDAITEHIITGA